MRAYIVPIAVVGLLLGGCDRASDAGAQGEGGNAAVAAPANSADAVPPPSPDEAPSSGAAAATRVYDTSHKGEAAPDIAFLDPAGKPVTLAAFRGRPLLVNLWATWCAPCVAELPTVDALAAAPPGKLQVLALSQDLDEGKVATFLSERKVKALKPYRDSKLAFSTTLGVSLPTTILYDSAGKEVWRFVGGTDWNGAEAKARLADAS